MTPKEERRVRERLKTLAGPVRLELADAGDPAGSRMAVFCETLARLCPAIGLRRAQAGNLSGSGIRLGPDLIFQSVPEGNELPPFLEALTGEKTQVPAAVSQAAAGIDLPVELKVYVAAGCPHCPDVVRRILQLRRFSDKVRVRVIDAVLFPEASRSDGVQSVPTVLLEGGPRWTGSVRLEEIVEQMLHRDPCRLGAESLRNFVENGDAERLARMMIDHGRLFPAILDLLAHPVWSVRLGAMVVLETIAGDDPQLARQAVEPLWERFQEADDTVKGDIVYVLGLTEDPGLSTRLELVVSGPYPNEVREAAAEALERIAG